MINPGRLFSKNRAVYEKTWVVENYAKRMTGFTPQETYCLEKVPLALRGYILDIGIGTGRTVAPLAAAFREYVGIDYSSGMVSTARQRYPEQDLRVMDATALQFEDAQFDVVFFSFNGIDHTDSKQRFSIQREMHRVLRQGGFLIYSTHNLGNRHVPTWLNSLWAPELSRSWKQSRFIINRLRKYSAQRSADENGIALVNDPDLNFNLLITYVDVPRELARLTDTGFTVRDVIGNKKTASGYDADDSWVYIVAAKN